jgi:PhoPQ-activated pathogenicity-related protein
MKLKFSLVPLASLLLMLSVTAPAYPENLPAKTALDRYVHQPDDSYSWKVVSESSADGMKTVVVDMISQTWRTSADVNRTQWQHYLTVAIPQDVRSDVAFLFIGGGRNGKEPPAGPSDRPLQIARATGTVVAEFGTVPNQPLIFRNDGHERTEDDLIAYTTERFLETGDVTWPARNAMVKSAVRALDTITALMASETGGGKKVDRFVVAGGSKRGWTTWLTGAVDDRVIGIVPIVIDVLNVQESMRHHFAAYGFWAPAIGDYVEHKLMERMSHPRMPELYALEDPYYYRHRLTKPKLILNASGDQFFLPDSSQFYWNDLQGPKYLRYVPNADHGLNRTDAVETISAFYWLLLRDKLPPEISWKVDSDGAFHVTSTAKPKEVLLWRATNPEARDFRVETLGRKYTSSVVQADASGAFVANVDQPSAGWTAYFVELTFDVGAPVPLKLTTNVQVTPDTLPYATKNPALPASLTIVCTAASDEAAGKLVDATKSYVADKKLSQNGLLTRQDGERFYINFRPAGEWEPIAGHLTEWLKQQGGDKFRYQLESGEGITAN